MDTIKAGRPLIDFIQLCYRANRPLLLEGRHGVGKSELLQQAADDLGIKCICRDLSLMEPPDLIGLPRSNGETTVYSPPDFLPRGGEGVLVFEELNRAEKYLQAPCLELLTSRTLNDYELPGGWLPAAAINPADSDYLVNEIDPALLSRFVRVQVTPDQQEWLRWATGNGIHPHVIRYVESDATIFDHADSNPRSWTYVSDLLLAAEKHQVSPPTLRSAILGTVGDQRGAAFLRSLKRPERPLTADDITDGYDNRRPDLQQWITAGRVDLVESSLDALLKHLQPEDEYQSLRGSGIQMANVRRFLIDLPGDLKERARNFFQERDYEFPLQRRRRATA